MVDFERLKQQAKILDLVGGNLKRVATTGGGEWAGPCPICGGNDRFRVQPAANIWLCRHCTNGKWRDVVDFIAARDGVGIVEAAIALGGSSFPASPGRSGKVMEKPTYHAYAPPTQEWQADGWQAVERCKSALFSEEGAKALDYLHRRGFTEDTLKHFNIGYSSGFTSGSAWIPHGITIPCSVGGVLWYLKVRTNTTPKYILVKGSKPAAIFNAEDLGPARVALLVEGEFNAMAAWQSLHGTALDDVAISSMGAAGYRPNLGQWGIFFINKALIMALFDDDDAGEKGAVALTNALGDRCKLVALPGPRGEGDLNDYMLANGGGAVFAWLKYTVNYWQE